MPTAPRFQILRTYTGLGTARFLQLASQSPGPELLQWTGTRIRQEIDLPYLLFSMGWAFPRCKHADISMPLQRYNFTMWNESRLAKGLQFPQPAPEGSAPLGHLTP